MKNIKLTAAQLSKAIDRRIKTEDVTDTKKIVTTLWSAIKNKSSLDPFYKADLMNWLEGDGSTVFLRDVLCEPFKDLDYGLSMHNPHGNAWMALDSWVYNLRASEQFLFPEITLGNGLELVFSHHCNFANPVYYGETSKGRVRFTILDDEIYTMSHDEEPCSPIKKDYQPSLFREYTYNFFKGNFVKKTA